jgi:dihydroorotate dehydrogenase (NAD+) catalytic subunit
MPINCQANVTDITIFGKAAEELGADAVSAVNTYLGMKINTKTGKPHFDNKIAGLSGPAIKPMAVRIIYQLYEAISIPIVGLGGIMTYDDMIEFIMAGAAVVSLGTLNMVHPTKAIDIINEWDENLSKGTIESIKSIQGCAHN